MKLCPALKQETMEEHNTQRRLQGPLADYVRLPACKRLINRVLTMQNEKNIKSIVVLSQFAGEGKTLFIYTLALGYLQLLNKRVLIMDTVSESRGESFYFQNVLEKIRSSENGSPGNSGCIDLITTKSLRQDSDQKDKTTAPAIINQIDPLDSADFQIADFVNSIKSDYDLILMDTCALNDVDQDCFDPLILALYADASIVVTSPESMDKDTMAQLTKELKRHHVMPLGFVVNSGLQA